MIAEQTYEKLKKMRMGHLAQILRDMCANPAYTNMAFDERLALLFDAEWEFRQNHKVQLLTKRAEFLDAGACIEDIDYNPARNLDKGQIIKLATCDYIVACKDILILGQTGVGKTYLGQAFGNAACRNHIPTRYIALQDLFDDLTVAEEAGRFREMFESFVKPALLIIDDYLLVEPSVEDAHRLRKLVERRMRKGSTIYCSQLAPEEWHARIKEDIVAEAILDRIVNRSYLIELKGDSMRKRLIPTT